MNDDRISVIEAADTIGYHKAPVFRILKRLGIETFKERSSNHSGQAISYISMDDFQLLQRDVASRKSDTNDESLNTDDSSGIEYGVFYLIQLEPEHDPGRLKVGFATNINERLRAHKCSAPFAVVVKTFACKRLWERTAIDCVTIDCDQLHTEVFRTDDLTRVLAKCDEFFSMMPDLLDDGEGNGESDAEQNDARRAADGAFTNGESSAAAG